MLRAILLTMSSLSQLMPESSTAMSTRGSPVEMAHARSVLLPAPSAISSVRKLGTVRFIPGTHDQCSHWPGVARVVGPVGHHREVVRRHLRAGRPDRLGGPRGGEQSPEAEREAQSAREPTVGVSHRARMLPEGGGRRGTSSPLTEPLTPIAAPGSSPAPTPPLPRHTPPPLGPNSHVARWPPPPGAATSDRCQIGPPTRRPKAPSPPETPESQRQSPMRALSGFCLSRGGCAAPRRPAGEP